MVTKAEIRDALTNPAVMAGVLGTAATALEAAAAEASNEAFMALEGTAAFLKFGGVAVDLKAMDRAALAKDLKDAQQAFKSGEVDLAIALSLRHAQAMGATVAGLYGAEVTAVTAAGVENPLPDLSPVAVAVKGLKGLEALLQLKDLAAIVDAGYDLSEMSDERVRFALGVEREEATRLKANGELKAKVHSRMQAAYATLTMALLGLGIVAAKYSGLDPRLVKGMGLAMTLAGVAGAAIKADLYGKIKRWHEGEEVELP